MVSCKKQAASLFVTPTFYVLGLIAIKGWRLISNNSAIAEINPKYENPFKVCFYPWLCRFYYFIWSARCSSKPAILSGESRDRINNDRRTDSSV
jgi:hypothetical protein